MATVGKVNIFPHYLSPSFTLFSPCGFIIIIILSVFGPCAQCQDGMSEQNKKTNKQTKQK